AGSMKKWQRFNNSLYLRLLCRGSGRPEMNVGEKMTEIINNTDKYPIMRDNGDNATVYYTGLAPYVNYFYDANSTKGDLDNYRFTEQMRKLMVWEDLYNDPRCNWMYKMNTNSTYNDEGLWKGAMSGGTQEQTAIQDRGTAYLNYDLYVQNPTTPTTWMDFAELQFILAEASLKGFIPGGEAAAKDYYKAGLTASVDRWSAIAATQLEKAYTLNDDEREFFLDCDLTSWPEGTEAQLKRIAEQKYIALFMIGFEAFHELHRTGYPELTIGVGCIYNLGDDNKPKFPTRFAYPATTLATNYANCMEALQRMGGNNNMRTNLWWSKAAIASGK
ncbi:MAG: SusD/RagB family nutrient-binding outer membrane lipoprotein, partial [Muribaculaceae bacterium]|nr:SusD/RagB family nutrient-binding outer membrane lipoprotein [Muribaculaceae bacterium]